jgi:transposase
MRGLLAQLKLELDDLNQWVSQVAATLKQIATESKACHRLLAIPEVGSITATAVIAAIGNGTPIDLLDCDCQARSSLSTMYLEVDWAWSWT